MDKFKLMALLFSVIGTLLMVGLAISVTSLEIFNSYNALIWVLTVLFIALYNMGVYVAYEESKD